MSFDYLYNVSHEAIILILHIKLNRKVTAAQFVPFFRRGNLTKVIADNKGADQPAHPRRLISAYVIRSLERVISKLTTGEISNY